MPNGEEEYIYELRVKRAYRYRQIYTEAQFKDVSTQIWAILTVRGSTYEIWNDDEDWEIRMQDSCGKSDAHTILLSNLERSSKLIKQCKQAEKMRPTGEQVHRPIYPSSAVGSSSLSSSQNNNYFLSHVPEPGMHK